MEEAIYKERPSQVGKIMAVKRGATLTEKQKGELQTLLNKIELTEKQAEKRDQLITKRDTPPELGDTGKKRVYEQYLKDRFNFKREFWSKETDKGNEQEDESIKLAAKVAGLFGITKNVETFENDFFKGTPDIITADAVIDVKTSWDASTFPMFKNELPDKDYLYQLLAYLDLTGRRVGYIAYCLTNASEEMIQDEIRREAWRRKIIDPTDEQIEEIEHDVRWAMEYNQFPDNLRVKFFRVDYCEQTVREMKERVILARTYYKQLQDQAAEMEKGPKL